MWVQFRKPGYKEKKLDDFKKKIHRHSSIAVIQSKGHRQLPRINPIHWKVLECIFLKAGFVFERQKGDHRIYTRKDCARPIVIPTYKEVDQDIIHSNIRSAQITREDYFKYLEECK